MSLLERLLPRPATLTRSAIEARLWSRRAKPPAPAPARRCYLHVRSMAADGSNHLFQFAMVDDAANVAFSVFASAPSPVGLPPPDAAPAPERAARALNWGELDAAMRPFRGAQVVAFGRLTQGAFLPPRTRAEIAGLDCARTRFLKLARRNGIKVDPGDLLDVNDARRLIGLPIVRSSDAALRALALRELCLWMDARS
jgi:hypothetical protein